MMLWGLGRGGGEVGGVGWLLWRQLYTGHPRQLGGGRMILVVPEAAGKSDVHLGCRSQRQTDRGAIVKPGR